MNDFSWMDHPAMKNIDARKLAILVDFVNQSEGKKPQALLPLLMATQNKLKKQNLSFTPEETDLMVQILTKDMTPADKAKFEQMKEMFKKHK